MPDAATHCSIGDVLAMLREEFPDITISKIRFLESQGLIDPERTPSGYRKFYDADVARLRWILHQQKEHFLPLKVIKGRLEQLELGNGSFTIDEVAAGAVDATDPSEPADPQPEASGRDDRGAGPTRARAARGAKAGARAGTAKAPSTKTPPKAPPAKTASGKTASGKTPAGTTTSGPTTPGPTKPPAGATSGRARPRAPAPPSLPLDDGRADDLAPDPSGVSLTRAELAKAAGLADTSITELESYGLLSPASEAGGRVLFDEDGLAIARLAAGFARHGIEARHLRMYRTFAEREVGLYQQVLLAVLRQRNPEARARAQEELAELAKLGRGLRTAYLRQAARQLLAE